tara:strand:+ start:448 stop:924 length:477 start_codon:yes stop_codon:yes gene_type:complete
VQSDWFFYPKYGTDIVDKVVSCFVNGHLSWEHNGYYWRIENVSNHNGWFHLYVHPDGNTDYYTETCFTEDAISGKDLTENMLILLTGENGCAQLYDPDIPGNGWCLEDVSVDEVLRCLSAEGTHIYAPCGERLWMRSVDTNKPEMMDMMDFILTRKVA